MGRNGLLTRSVLTVAALAAGVAAAAPRLSTEYRYASQVGEWFVRGDAATSPSKVFPGGLRLAAWDGQNEQDLTRVAVAAAVYFFQVPPQAQSVAIQIGYRADPAARNRDVAGFLFVRDLAVERQYAQFQDEAARPVEAPGFFGNTYLLPANQQQMVVNLPVRDHVVDGALEVHLSAGAGQVFDAQYLQVASFGQELPMRVEHAPSTYYMPNPYDYTYTYYYAGPFHYPRVGYFVRFDSFDNAIDPFYWGGWASFRACFYTHHRWVYRPARFVHYRPLVVVRPVYVVRPAIVKHRDRWYRRHFGLDRRRLTEPEIHRLIRRRVQVVTPDRLRDYRSRTRRVAEQVRASDRQFRTRLGSAGFADRLRTWKRNPAQARQELTRPPRTPTIERRTAPQPRTVERTRPTIVTPSPRRTYRVQPTPPSRTPTIERRTTQQPRIIQRTPPARVGPTQPWTYRYPTTPPARTPTVERRTMPQPRIIQRTPPTTVTPRRTQTPRYVAPAPAHTPRVERRTTPQPRTIERTPPTTVTPRRTERPRYVPPTPTRTPKVERRSTRQPRSTVPTPPARTPKVERRRVPQPAPSPRPSPRPVAPSTSRSLRRPERAPAPTTRTPSRESREPRSRGRERRR